MDNNEFMREINECTSRGICSTPPNIAALYELILHFLEQAAFYIVKLEKLGLCNDTIKNEVISDISSLVSINEFGEQQLYNIALRNYYLLVHAKETYTNACKKTDKPLELLDYSEEFDENTPLYKAISIGEKLNLKSSKNSTKEKKALIDILLVVIKSTARDLAKLNDYCNYDNEVYLELLKGLSFINNIKCDEQKIKEEIKSLSSIDKQLRIDICKYLFKNFGPISKVEVSRSSHPAKVILVSGNSFKELDKVLNATKNTDIDIYTHSNLLITHAFEKFKEYKNLKGHYGSGGTSNILDFATFPGSILLTRNTNNTADYLYRGRIFSNDFITHPGVIKIENDDYSPLIKSSLEAKGFSKGKIKNNILIGYDENKITDIFLKISKKLERGDIKQLYIIGPNPFSEIQKDYFNEFFEEIKSNEYVISFSYKSSKKNILTIDIGNYIPLYTHLLSELFDKINCYKDRIILIFTVCDSSTISEIISLKNNGLEKIYISSCSPTMVNPSVFETFKNEYKINELSDIRTDFLSMRKNKRAL